MRSDYRPHKISRLLNEFRHSLSYAEALPQLTLLGLVVGLTAGALIVSFRLVMDSSLNALLPGGADSFESLDILTRTAFIAIGVFIIGGLAHFAGDKSKDVSVSHVIHRLQSYQGKLPVRNWLYQFFAGLACLISGQSAGREGPAVHIGAGAASMLGQWLKLPNNSMHTLIACGVAAGIAAAFDTPLAGVIFAMEVIVMEYTIAGFLPVILASVMGAMMSQAVFGKAHIFTLGDTNLTSLAELPYMVICGLVLSACAAVYIRLNIAMLKYKNKSLWLRLTVAAAITILVALPLPEIMGMGYDTVNLTLAGKLSIGLLLAIALAKLVVTPIIIGLGVPGGLIGPLIVIGACIGQSLGLFTGIIFPEFNANPSFYVMLGMAGMLAATLNAPLTALITVLELTYNPNLIFPTMLVIVASCIGTRYFFGLESIFTEQLKFDGHQLDTNPAENALKRVGVRSMMDRRFTCSERFTTLDKAQKMLDMSPNWIVIESGASESDSHLFALTATDLKAFISGLIPEEKTSIELDLNSLPGTKFKLAPVGEHENLLQALKNSKEKNTQLLYVRRLLPSSSQLNEVQGIVTVASIEKYYHPRESH